MKHGKYLESLGATHVIDRRTLALEREIQKITTTPVEYVFDAISTEDTQQIGYDILASSGHLILVSSAVVQEVTGKTVTISTVAAAHHLPQNRRPQEILYSNITRLLAYDRIKVRNGVESYILIAYMVTFPA